MLKIYILLLFSFCHLWAEEGTIVTLAYYDYPEENHTLLQTIPSELTMTKERLAEWDKALLTLAAEQEMTEGDLYRLYSYLYTAQRDAAILSFEATGRYKGSLDATTLGIIHLFYPLFTPPFPLQKDDYSQRLAEIILPSFKNRFNREEQNIASHEHVLHMFYWTGKSIEFGESTLGWTPWVLSPIGTDEKLNQSLIAPIENVDESFASDFLSLNIPASSHQNNWVEASNPFLFSHDLPFSKIVLIRSIIAITLYDEIITNTKIKYLYGLKEGKVPSIHLTLRDTAISLLQYFFPQGTNSY